ncbi:MAG: T9SS type A sorting domain-containing protein [Bacteroidota bacterium]
MKKFILFFIVITGLTCNSFAQIPGWEWAKKAGGSGEESGVSVCIDGTGNVYLAGRFSSPSIVFGSTTLTNSSPGTSDVFLVKYSSAGNVIWARSASGSDFDGATAVSVDPSGNVYMTGLFTSPVINISGTLLNNPGYGSSFIAKYTSAGALVWAKRCSDVGEENAYAMYIDPAGNLFVVGDFYGQSVIFGTDTLHQSTTLQNYQGFLVKYNSAGSPLWAKTTVGSIANSMWSVSGDAAGNVYVCGDYSGSSIQFGSIILANQTGYSDSFVAKYSGSGNEIWVRGIVGDIDENAYSIVSNDEGYICVAGTFSGSTVEIVPLSTEISICTQPNNDIFLARLDPNGNPLWIKSVQGCGYKNSWAVAIDSSDNVYLSGNFQSRSLIIDSSEIANAVTTNNYYDMFLAKYDSTGGLLWVDGAGGNYNDEAIGLAVDPSGKSYTTGYYESSSIAFDNTTLTNAGSSDIFLAKHNASSVTVFHTDVSCYGNNDGSATVSIPGLNPALFTYIWNTLPAQNTPSITGLVPGNYCVTVNDGMGGTFSTCVSITQPAQIIEDNPQTLCYGESYTIGVHTYSVAGTYYDTIATGPNCYKIVKTILVVNPTPPTPVITNSYSRLYSNVSSGNQWYRNDSMISGANNSWWWPDVSGFYYDIVEQNGCISDTSNVIFIRDRYISGEITYRPLGGMTYEATVEICRSWDMDPTGPILFSWGDGSNDSLILSAVHVIPIYSFWDIGLIGPFNCNVYKGIHTFSTPGNYILSLPDLGRPQFIQNIDSSWNTGFYLESFLAINNPIDTNNSVHFSNPSLGEGYHNNTMTYNPGAYDVDGDSLSFSLVNCMSNGAPTAGYHLPSGLMPSSLNPQTGLLTWNLIPWHLGPYNIAIRIDEWRQGVNIGYVIREVELEIGSMVSVNEDAQQNSSVILYPNPAQNNITIITTQNPSISFLNIQGQLMKTVSSNSNKTVVDVSAFPVGLYLVEVRTEKGVEVRKFVKE